MQRKSLAGRTAEENSGIATLPAAPLQTLPACSSLPALFRSVLYALRGGFLIRPLALALVLGAAGAVLSSLEESISEISSWISKVLFPSQQDRGVAQIILSSIATSIMTVVSIVFAILLMTLTLAKFSPLGQLRQRLRHVNRRPTLPRSRDADQVLRTRIGARTPRRVTVLFSWSPVRHAHWRMDRDGALHPPTHRVRGHVIDLQEQHVVEARRTNAALEWIAAALDRR